MPEIIVTVKKNGNLKINANGFEGKECTKITEPLERALGTVQDQAHKSEYYMAETERVKVSN